MIPVGDRRRRGRVRTAVRSEQKLDPLLGDQLLGHLGAHLGCFQRIELGIGQLGADFDRVAWQVLIALGEEHAAIRAALQPALDRLADDTPQP